MAIRSDLFISLARQFQFIDECRNQFPTREWIVDDRANFTSFALSCPGWWDHDQIKDYSLLSSFSELLWTHLSLFQDWASESSEHLSINEMMLLSGQAEEDIQWRIDLESTDSFVEGWK